MNMGKTKNLVGGLDLDLLKRSGKVPCGVCQKGVGTCSKDVNEYSDIRIFAFRSNI